MAKTEHSSQLNLTVVALVALVAIVGLVALVLHTANIAKLPIGSKIVRAENNIAGEGRYLPSYVSSSKSGAGGSCVKEGGSCDRNNKCCAGAVCQPNQAGRPEGQCINLG